MPVRIAKPAVNIREKLAELERPIGLNGSALMRTETPQEAFSLIGAGRKNLLINGNFKFWQRGTSFTNSPGYTADRWFNISNHTGSTVTRESFANGQTEVPGGPEYFYRSSITSTSTPGDRIAWGQKIENWKIFLGNTFTLSGWYRRTCALSGTSLQLNMHQSSGFYDASHTMSYSTDDLFPITSTWKFFKLTFTVPSTAAGTMTDSANYTLRLYYQVCGASGNFDLANMQLEQGKVATPFEQRSFGEELALCQRYYEKSYDIDIAPGSNIATNGRSAVYFSGTSDTAGNMITHVSFNVLKRGTPTITFYRNDGTINVWDYNKSGTSGTVTMTTTQHGNRGFCPYANVGGNNISASFNGSWTASAEI